MNPNHAPWQDRARRVAHGIRCRVLEHTLKNNGGYVSQACSSAEILSALYLKIMQLGPVPEPLLPKPFAGVPGPANPAAFRGVEFNGPTGPEFDRFILSPSQYSLVLYAALIELGRMAPQGLEQFNQDGGTVEMIGAEHSPGMELMSGSLGQGLSQAAGVAWARKRKGDSGRVWVFMSDGEFQIGQTWEAVQVLAFHHLDNLGIYVDMNGYQCDGKMTDVMNIEPLDQRLQAFGAQVHKVPGHDLEALARPAYQWQKGQPLVVLAYTHTSQGIEILQANAPKYHYLRFKNEAERQAYAAYLETMRSQAV